MRSSRARGTATTVSQSDAADLDGCVRLARTHVLGEVDDLGRRLLWHTIFRARGHSGAQVEVPEQHLWTLRDGKILRLQWFHDPAEAAAQPARS